MNADPIAGQLLAKEIERLADRVNRSKTRLGVNGALVSDLGFYVIEYLPDILAALRASLKNGAAAMQWKPTGSGTASINGMGGTTEWFRQFDGRRESYPHGFNPNIGGYVDVRMGLSNPPPLDLTTEAQNAARTLDDEESR